MRTFSNLCAGAILALLSLFLASPAPAGEFGVTAGGARDFIKIDGDWDELASPLAGIAYDVVLADDGTAGLSFGMRASQDGGLIQDYGVGYWKTTEVLELFGDVHGVLLDEDYLGEFKLLGGVRGGVRFDASGLPFEVSAHYAVGSDEVAFAGLFFGLRATTGE